MFILSSSVFLGFLALFLVFLNVDSLDCVIFRLNFFDLIVSPYSYAHFFNDFEDFVFDDFIFEAIRVRNSEIVLFQLLLDCVILLSNIIGNVRDDQMDSFSADASSLQEIDHGNSV